MPITPTATPNFLKNLEQRNLELKGKIDRTWIVEEQPTFDFSTPIETEQLNIPAQPQVQTPITPQEQLPAPISNAVSEPTQELEFTSEDVANFRDLLSKWIDPIRIKRLIIESKQTQKPISFEPSSTELLARWKEELKEAVTPEPWEWFIAWWVKWAVTWIKWAISTVWGLASLASEKAVELSWKWATKLWTLIEQFKWTVTPEQAQQTFLEIIKEPEFFDQDEQSKADIINLASSFLVPAWIISKGKTTLWILWKLGRWALAWVAWVTAWEVQLEGELPSPWEAIAWWALWAVIPWLPIVWKAIKQRIFPIESIEKIVWRIVQGKKKDISKAVETLKKLDTKWINTYEWLKTTVTEKGKVIVWQVDERLLKDKRAFWLDELIKTTKVWEKEVKTNFVSKALDQLTKFADDIDDDVLKAEISEFSDKFTNKTATLKDINDLARKHNVEISSKAFSKTWEPLTSVWKLWFENIRKWTKETVRDLLPDETTRILDKEFSELANTKRLIEKMEEAVNTLEQKVKPRWILESVWRFLWRSIDTISWGSLRWFLTWFLPSNIWNKTQNSLDLQDELRKNLDIIEDILWAKKESGIAKKLAEFINKLDIKPEQAWKLIAIPKELPKEQEE